MKFDGWQRLNAAYAKQFGIETRSLPDGVFLVPRTAELFVQVLGLISLTA
jgi:hypothetical protein